MYAALLVVDRVTNKKKRGERNRSKLRLLLSPELGTRNLCLFAYSSTTSMNVIKSMSYFLIAKRIRSIVGLILPHVTQLRLLRLVKSYAEWPENRPTGKEPQLVPRAGDFVRRVTPQLLTPRPLLSSLGQDRCYVGSLCLPRVPNERNQLYLAPSRMYELLQRCPVLEKPLHF